MGRLREIRPVTREDTRPFLIDIHYAGRFPSVSYAYGLFVDDELEGVITYGTPPSSSLRSGVAGERYKGYVLELNRLCLKTNTKNDASWLVGASLKLLSRDSIVVSFADTSQDHLGKVYQATNFIYTGLSAKRTDWALKGKEHLHGYTIGDEFRGQPNRSKLMREKYGEDFYLKPRPRKHRYVTFTGSRKFKRTARENLKYPIVEYPK